MNRDLEYEKNNAGFWPYSYEDSNGVKCKNYEICGSVLPMWWHTCKGCYICAACDKCVGGNN